MNQTRAVLQEIMDLVGSINSHHNNVALDLPVLFLPEITLLLEAIDARIFVHEYAARRLRDEPLTILGRHAQPLKRQQEALEVKVPRQAHAVKKAA